MNYIMNFFWKSSQQTQPTNVQSSSLQQPVTTNSSNNLTSNTTTPTYSSINDQQGKTEIVNLVSTGNTSQQPFTLNLNKKRLVSLNINNDINDSIESVNKNFVLPSIPSPRNSNKFQANNNKPSFLLNPNLSTKDLQSKLNDLKEKLNETTISPSSSTNSGTIFSNY